MVLILSDSLLGGVGGGGRTLNESPRATDAAPWLAACGEGMCSSGHAVDWPYMSFLGSCDPASSAEEPFCRQHGHSLSSWQHTRHTEPDATLWGGRVDP